jgi:hypothetical protein
MASVPWRRVWKKNIEHRIKEVLLSQPGYRRGFTEPTVEQWAVFFRPDGLPSVLIRG